MNDGQRARKIFRDLFGPGPWPCFFCGEMILSTEVPRTKFSLNVHHHDGNRKNNSKRNLKATHQTCHNKYHYIAPLQLGRKFSEEHRAKISVRHKGKVYSAETRAKISAAQKGKRLSEETKEKMRLAQQKRRQRERDG